jgi:hypothetical protein
MSKPTTCVGAGSPALAPHLSVRSLLTVARRWAQCVITSIFPYLEAYYCWWGGQEWMKAVVMTGYVIWCMLLFVVLATTADDYFAPSLTTLSEWMGLRERVAGLTFLALGNGAADMFSVIAAVRVGATDLAVGALQGGSMCVTCVVTAGVLMVVRGGEVKASGVFFTDVVVNVVSCIAIFIMLNKGYTNFWEGLGLLGLYTVYVLGVSMVGHGWIPPMLAKDRAAWRLKKEAEADLQEHLATVRKNERRKANKPTAAAPCRVAAPLCLRSILARRHLCVTERSAHAFHAWCVSACLSPHSA